MQKQIKIMPKTKKSIKKININCINNIIKNKNCNIKNNSK